MKYVGSKNRIAKYIVPIIQSYIDDNHITKYLEPCVGGGNVIDKIICEHKYGSDNNKYLIALLKQTQIDTNAFPITITKDEYNQVKLHKDDYDDWYVGLIGFCASYNGKWFGGYANNVKTKIGTIRNYTDEAIRNLIKQSSSLNNIIFSCCDFRDINKNIKDFVIYYDIPYQNTTKYGKKQDFPYDEFYKQCKELCKNNIVLISEYNMPNDFECIWEKEIECTLDKNKRDNRVEKLFICK